MATSWSSHAARWITFSTWTMTKLHATSASPSAWQRPSRRLSHVRRSACRYSASKYLTPTSTSCLCRPRATWTSDARNSPSRRTRCAPSPTRYTRHSHPQNNDLQGCKSSALTDHNIEATVSRHETVAFILQKDSFHDTPPYPTSPTAHVSISTANLSLCNQTSVFSLQCVRKSPTRYALFSRRIEKQFKRILFLFNLSLFFLLIYFI